MVVRALYSAAFTVEALHVMEPGVKSTAFVRSRRIPSLTTMNGPSQTLEAQSSILALNQRFD